MGNCVQQGNGTTEFGEQVESILAQDGPGHEAVEDANANPKDKWFDATPGEPEPVVLNIYNIGTSGGSKVLNAMLHPFGTGVFHCGVEVYGREWSYAGKHTAPGKPGKYTGVFCSTPCNCDGHTYCKSVQMGLTASSEKEVLRLLKLLRAGWLVDEYGPLTHNCCHFCDDLCQRLGVGAVPTWAVSLADTGAFLAAHGDTRCCQEVAGQTVQAAEHVCSCADKRQDTEDEDVEKPRPPVPWPSPATQVLRHQNSDMLMERERRRRFDELERLEQLREKLKDKALSRSTSFLRDHHPRTHEAVSRQNSGCSAKSGRSGRSGQKMKL